MCSGSTVRSTKRTGKSKSTPAAEAIHDESDPDPDFVDTKKKPVAEPATSKRAKTNQSDKKKNKKQEKQEKQDTGKQDDDTKQQQQQQEQQQGSVLDFLRVDTLAGAAAKATEQPTTAGKGGTWIALAPFWNALCTLHEILTAHLSLLWLSRQKTSGRVQRRRRERASASD